MARVLLPLPDTDFDVTEVAVPWRMLTDAGRWRLKARVDARVARYREAAMRRGL